MVGPSITVLERPTAVPVTLEPILPLVRHLVKRVEVDRMSMTMQMAALHARLGIMEMVRILVSRVHWVRSLRLAAPSVDRVAAVCKDLDRDVWIALLGPTLAAQ